ncbi:MAG: hypothetical protein KF869_12000 [Phycisphaeraceae bacterium]|nr:hypothetical protein [Phycisphaeraceae bacterium]
MFARTIAHRKVHAAGVALVCAATSLAASGDPPRPTQPQPSPVRPGLPGSVQNELGVDRGPSLVREGAFVSSARGALVKGKSGRWFFVFDRDRRGRQMPPMVVLPSEHLAAMERLAARMDEEDVRQTGARMVVTGQVMAYAGHNYLLPTAPPLVDTPAAESETDETDSHAEPKPAAGPTTATDPAVAEPTIEQIVADLDRAIGSRRAANPSRTAAADSSGAENGTPRLRPAGVLTPRRGRVVRSAAGEPVFIMDSGSSGVVPEPPMVLLPCANLAGIESIAERLGENATFTISGQVLVYKDRNYLLPAMYTVNRAGDQVIPNQ